MTGVVWWEMMVSHYQGLYRRARHGEPAGGYTRDFLQGPRAVSDAFRAMFRETDPPYEPLVYRWPGDSFPGGRIYTAADYEHNRRVDVGQWTGMGAPAPWRLGDPSADPLVTLEGSTELAIPEAATAQWRRIERSQPFLVMVQLDWSQTELHLRAYLGSPPAHLTHAALDNVPPEMRVLMKGRGGSVLGRGLPALAFDADDLRRPWRTLAADTARPATTPGAAEPVADVAGSTLGKPYQPADENMSSASAEPFEVDPDERDRSTRLHAATQNALSAAVLDRGCTPRSPEGQPSYDLAWNEPDGTVVVAEVKSVKPQNSERQLRLGLGQLLRYCHLVEDGGPPARGVLVLSGPPHDPRWVDLCASLGVGLIWMPDLGAMLQACLDRHA